MALMVDKELMVNMDLMELELSIVKVIHKMAAIDIAERADLKAVELGLN